MLAKRLTNSIKDKKVFTKKIKKQGYVRTNRKIVEIIKMSIYFSDILAGENLDIKIEQLQKWNESFIAVKIINTIKGR